MYITTPTDVKRTYKDLNPDGCYFSPGWEKSLNSRIDSPAYRTADGAWIVFVEITRRAMRFPAYLGDPTYEDGETEDHFNVCFLNAREPERFTPYHVPAIVGNARDCELKSLSTAREAARGAVETYDNLNNGAPHIIMPDPLNQAWLVWYGGFHWTIQAYRMDNGEKLYGQSIPCGAEGPTKDQVMAEMLQMRTHPHKPEN